MLRGIHDEHERMESREDFEGSFAIACDANRRNWEQTMTDTPELGETAEHWRRMALSGIT